MGPEECLFVIRKAVSALEPDGLILVHDFFLSDTHDAPLFPALFALNMLVNTLQGRSYSEKEVKDMLSGAGVKEVIRLPFRAPPTQGSCADGLDVTLSLWRRRSGGHPPIFVLTSFPSLFKVTL
jgi:hypothetical protein